MWNDRYSATGPLARIVFDPTGGLLTAGLTLAGGAIGAAGTLAGGANAAQIGRMRQGAAEFQATQDTMNSAAEIAAAGRRAVETSQQANLVGSRARAFSAASGADAGAGSALTNEAQIAARGRYATALDIFQGQNQATAELNKATAAHYTGAMDVAGGEMERRASEFAAAGTLAGSGASAFRMYGMTRNPGAGYGAGYGFGGGYG
jgi:hypothetical protein